MAQQFIAGIYNYCDRWCERCSFTTRCRNFESRDKSSSVELDANNKEFWNAVSANLTKAIELLHKAAAQHGIDLDHPMSKEEEEAYEERQAFIRSAAKNHPLSKLCKQYSKTVRPFVEKNEGMVDEQRNLMSELQMGIRTEEEVVHTVVDIGDCFDIIQWYLFFIDPKLQRALHGKLEADEDDAYQSDSNGSAKIAIIAIERSINAWLKLYELLPLSEDLALQALSLLSQLKQKALIEFPHAMDFKRPGFDA